MSAFYLLCSSVQCNATESIVHAIQNANENCGREEQAAIKIQSTARRMFQRRRYVTIVKRIVDVQRTFRGYLGRKEVLRKQMRELQRFHEAYFFHFASQIQRIVRGYLLRKNHADFYARKRYLMTLADKSEAVREETQRLAEEQQLVKAEEQHAARVAEYRTATSKKHHLLSTCSVPGIYRPPLSTEGVVTVFGTNVEEDIRHQGNAMAKDTMVSLNKSLKSTMLANTSSTNNNGNASGRKFKPDLPTASSSNAVATIGGKSGASNTISSAAGSSPARSSTLIPHAPAQQSSSLQNAVPYAFEREQLSMQRTVDQKFSDSLHNGKKFGIRKTEAPAFGTTINAECQYVEKSAIISQRRK